MIVLIIQLGDPDLGIDTDADARGYIHKSSRAHVHWTHWFFETYTTRYLYTRSISVVHDVNYDVVYRWVKRL